MSTDAMDNGRIGFLDVAGFDNGTTIRGAVLVTNSATDPVEFRCTSAVRPTEVQKLLWGRRMSGHIASQLIGKPLLEAITNPVVVVIVKAPEFLELRPLIRVPLIQILRHEELNLASPLSLPEGDGDMIESAGGRLEPLVRKIHRDFVEDWNSVRALLTETFRSHSLLEPFERIKNALEMIQKEGKG